MTKNAFRSDFENNKSNFNNFEINLKQATNINFRSKVV